MASILARTRTSAELPRVRLSQGPSELYDSLRSLKRVYHYGVSCGLAGHKLIGTMFLPTIAVPHDQHFWKVSNISALHFLHSTQVPNLFLYLILSFSISSSRSMVSGNCTRQYYSSRLIIAFDCQDRTSIMVFTHKGRRGKVDWNERALKWHRMTYDISQITCHSG